MIISSFVRLSMVVLLAHSVAHEITQSEAIPRGQIVERVEALSDSSQSYALYLPSNYTPNRKWPVLYAFDPAARGRVPVERFKEAAEKYGWIVLGSNNSRNGPWNVVVNAWNAMLTDTHQRFAIDDERSYATGFSGGARAAVHRCSVQMPRRGSVQRRGVSHRSCSIATDAFSFLWCRRRR